jgi:aspartyl protease family protein
MKYITFIFFVFLLFHLAGCEGCSRSAQKRKLSRTQNSTDVDEPRSHGRRNVVKMEKIAGVYQIKTEINDIPMYFIFDTGAGMISISEVEATFLYKQGKLTDDDILGTANFSDANGDISEGTVVMLRTVKIGNKVLRDVKASVVHNLGAPLLMGQSALESFGKISIDYHRSEIAFE